MTAAEVLTTARASGVTLWAEGDALRYRGPREALTADVLDQLKLHKAELLAELARPDPLPPVPRGLGGYATPPGVPPLGDCALARQIRSMPAEGDPDPLSQQTPDRHLPGISPEFAARLSAEDLEDIKARDIALGTVQAFERAAIAREARDLRAFFEERAGILEHDGGLPRADAELAKVAVRKGKRVVRQGGVRRGA